MINLIQILIRNGWKYKQATNAVPHKEEFPGNIPAEVLKFCRSFDELSLPDDTFWFFSYMDYLGLSDSAFKWNEFELNDFEFAINDTQRALVCQFWRRHFPLAMSVRDDHAYIAVGIDKENAGQIFLGENSDESETELLAVDLDAFVVLVEDFYFGNRAHPLSRLF